MSSSCETFDRYKILHPIGEGGMGKVFLAEDTTLNRKVALKFLPESIERDLAAQKRFLREAKAAAALDHPYICKIYEIEQTEDKVFIVMEYVLGDTLKQRLAKGPLALKEALQTAAEIAEALEEAHNKQIVHRDIKPANIMLSPQGHVKVLDFGLAKQLAPMKSLDETASANLTQEGSLIGTLAYMSPEQVRQRQVDTRSDIFSFGVLLYEMLTGVNPFQRTTSIDTADAILNETQPPVFRYRREVPEILEHTVTRMLAKLPDRRYQSIHEVRTDLSQVDAGWVAAIPSQTSIAVLPFRDMSREKDQDYLCEGVAEELINALTKIEGLHVAAMTSASQFKGKALDIRKIGEQLNVATLLEGSVRKSGNKLRITAQLINVADGYHLWSERYDHDLEDVFAVQDKIARTVVETLKIKLAGKQDTRLIKSYTENLEAYGLYLKGRYFWNKRNAEGLRRAIEYFKQTIAEDPNYALAYAGLADSYNVLAFHSPSPPAQAWPLAKAAALKALEIDDTLAAAHASLGYVRSACDWDWPEAEREFKRAIELNPGYAIAHHWYANMFLSPMGRLDEALSEMKRALELDPLSLIINTSLGGILNFRREYDQAIEQHRRTLELDPNFYFAHLNLGQSYLYKKRYEEALASFQMASALSGNTSWIVGSLAYCYALIGERDKAQKLLDELKELSTKTYVSALTLARILIGLGEIDTAFEYLEKAYEERSVWLIWIKVGALFDGVRSDPRFVALLKRMGLENENAQSVGVDR